MRFSLIIGTLNRKNELDICIEHILNQSFKDYEIVIVDQSDEDYSEIANRSDKIKYIHIKEKGLSHARNIAIKVSKGEYICLVDDDGLYEPNVLEVADKIIADKSPTILGGKIIDPVTGLSNTNDKEKIVTWKNAFKYHVSPSMIIQRSFLEKHMFDEMFGVGSKYGAGEETDIVFAALSEKKMVYFSSEYVVKHGMGKNNKNKNIDRITSYAYGRGALLKKVVKNYSLFWGSYYFYRSLLLNSAAGYIILPIINKDKAMISRLKASSLLHGYKDYM